MTYGNVKEFGSAGGSVVSFFYNLFSLKSDCLAIGSIGWSSTLSFEVS